MQPPTINIHFLRTVIINSITASVALGLMLNRRRNKELEPAGKRDLAHNPRVKVIIPARNEEANVEPLLRSLLSQDYPTESYSITLVDDSSTDRTRELATKLAEGAPNLRLVPAGALPAGWTGKTNAMFTGAQSASPETEWLLFVDADTRHHPQMLPTVIREAERASLDLLSLVIDVHMQSFWERVIVPQVGEVYTLLVGTMDLVNTPGTKGAAANGQFMLVRKALYDEVGALDSVRSDVAEDRAIAAAFKERGHKVRLAYGRKLVHARVYGSLGEMWGGYSKTLFWASGHNLPKTLLVVLALSLYGLVPFASFGYALLNTNYEDRASALRHAPLQLLPMIVLRIYVCKSMGIPAGYAVLYPLGVAVTNAMLLFSMYRVLSGKGVAWKGRVYKR